MQNILAVVDNDWLKERVVRTAGKMAQDLGAMLTVLHVMPESDYEEILSRMAQDRVDRPFSINSAENHARWVAEEAAAALAGLRVQWHTRGSVGNPADKILELASEAAVDMIVIGFEGLRGLERLRALGSVSRKVMENAACPVLMVPVQATVTAEPGAAESSGGGLWHAECLRGAPAGQTKRGRKRETHVR